MFPRCVAGIVSWRSVAFLAALACVLQVTNLVLTWQLKQREMVAEERAGKEIIKKQHQHPQIFKRRDLYVGQKVSDDHQITLTRIARWGVLDGSGGYRMAVGAVRGILEQKQQPECVTLVTQCSLQHLHKIPSLVKNWQGAVSVAVFAMRSEVVAAVQAIHRLRHCHLEVQQNVTFSIVHPLGSNVHPNQDSRASSTLQPAAALNPNLSPASDSECNIQQEKVWKNYEYQGVEYPNNLLRNTARKAAVTPFIFVVDVDMMPSPGLHRAFCTYIQEEEGQGNVSEGAKGKLQGGKTVWVVPAYEIEENATEPVNKEELLAMRERGQARQFYEELCLKCQKFTDYPAWERGRQGEIGRIRGMYEVLWRDPWEPFYLAPVSVPLYDERFRQYGFNRISQVCELHVAGYKFKVLDSAFLIHRGFKTQSTLHSGKDVELEHNRLLFRQFKVELKAKYPESSRRCY